jgi:hypothetical protein
MWKKWCLLLLLCFELGACALEASPEEVFDSALTNIEEKMDLKTQVTLKGKDNQTIINVQTQYIFDGGWDVQFSNPTPLNDNENFKRLCRMNFLSNSFTNFKMKDVEGKKRVTCDIVEKAHQHYQEIFKPYLTAQLEGVRLEITVTDDDILESAYLTLTSLNETLYIEIERLN